jgi:broad specificity phosphatase PhoE
VYTIPDPVLTELGIEQCKLLRDGLKQRLEGESDVAIIASPMRRTLQTAQLGLDWLIESGVRVTADPNWQGRPPFNQET